MSAHKNLFWGLVCSVGLFPACTISKPVANDKQNSLTTLPDSSYETHYNSIIAHQTVKPQSFRSHSVEFAESRTVFTEGTKVSSVGINIKDSTYFLKTMDYKTNNAVTTYMGRYDRQSQDAKNMFAEAQAAVSRDKRKLQPGGPYMVSAPDSNTVTILSRMGDFQHKTVINKKDRTMFECVCDPDIESAKRKYARNAKLAYVADKFTRSKKFKIGNTYQFFN